MGGPRSVAPRESHNGGQQAQIAVALQRAQQSQQLLQESSNKFQALVNFLCFDDPAAFDKALGRSGKSPHCLGKAPGGAPAPQRPPNKIPSEHLHKVKVARAARTALVEKARKEKDNLLPQDVLEQLQEVYYLYSDKLLQISTGRREMDIVGFCRLLRDCRLLDNRLTLVQADVLFTQVDSAADCSSISADLHLDWAEFQRALQRLLRVKFPAGSGQPADMVLLLAKRWLLPFHKGYQSIKPADAIYARQSLNMMRRHDKHFKQLFSWYATLPESELTRVQWEHVRNTNATLGSSEFVLMAHNFQIMPTLITKHEVIEVFEQCEAENDGDGQADTVLYPAFLEAFVQLALHVAEHAALRIPVAFGSDEVHIFQRYIAACPPPLGPRLDALLADTLQARGRDFDANAPVVLSYEPQIRAMNERADAVQQQEHLFQSFNTVVRREEMRQKFALTRLKNYYRDVRTGRNQQIWVPDQPTGTTGLLKETTTMQVEASPGSATSNPVAFFSDSRQIKPPQRQAVNVDPPGAPWAGGGDSHASPNRAELLQQSEQQFQAYMRASPSRASPGGLPSPGRNGGGTTAPRSPKAYQLAPLEDIEESEAILDLIKKLPSIGDTHRSSRRSDGGGSTGRLTDRSPMSERGSTGRLTGRAAVAASNGNDGFASLRAAAPSSDASSSGNSPVVGTEDGGGSAGPSPPRRRLPPLRGPAKLGGGVGTGSTRLPQLRRSRSLQKRAVAGAGAALRGSGGRPYSAEHLMELDPEMLQVLHLSE